MLWLTFTCFYVIMLKFTLAANDSIDGNSTRQMRTFSKEEVDAKIFEKLATTLLKHGQPIPVPSNPSTTTGPRHHHHRKFYKRSPQLSRNPNRHTFFDPHRHHSLAHHVPQRQQYQPQRRFTPPSKRFVPHPTADDGTSPSRGEALLEMAYDRFFDEKYLAEKQRIAAKAAEENAPKPKKQKRHILLQIGLPTRHIYLHTRHQNLSHNPVRPVASKKKVSEKPLSNLTHKPLAHNRQNSTLNAPKFSVLKIPAHGMIFTTDRSHAVHQYSVVEETDHDVAVQFLNKQLIQKYKDSLNTTIQPTAERSRRPPSDSQGIPKGSTTTQPVSSTTEEYISDINPRTLEESVENFKQTNDSLPKELDLKYTERSLETTTIINRTDDLLRAANTSHEVFATMDNGGALGEQNFPLEKISKHENETSDNQYADLLKETNEETISKSDEDLIKITNKQKDNGLLLGAKYNEWSARRLEENSDEFIQNETNAYQAIKSATINHEERNTGNDSRNFENGKEINETEASTVKSEVTIFEATEANSQKTSEVDLYEQFEKGAARSIEEDASIHDSSSQSGTARRKFAEDPTTNGEYSKETTQSTILEHVANGEEFGSRFITNQLTPKDSVTEITTIALEGADGTMLPPISSEIPINAVTKNVSGRLLNPTVNPEHNMEIHYTIAQDLKVLDFGNANVTAAKSNDSQINQEIAGTRLRKLTATLRPEITSTYVPVSEETMTEHYLKHIMPEKAVDERKEEETFENDSTDRYEMQVDDSFLPKEANEMTTARSSFRDNEDDDVDQMVLESYIPVLKGIVSSAADQNAQNQKTKFHVELNTQPELPLNRTSVAFQNEVNATAQNSTSDSDDRGGRLIPPWLLEEGKDFQELRTKAENAEQKFPMKFTSVEEPLQVEQVMDSAKEVKSMDDLMPVIPVIVEDLRNGAISNEDQMLLQEFFGEQWADIMKMAKRPLTDLDLAMMEEEQSENIRRHRRTSRSTNHAGNKLNHDKRDVHYSEVLGAYLNNDYYNSYEEDVPDDETADIDELINLGRTHSNARHRFIHTGTKDT